MQKREALGRARAARSERRWRRAVGRYAKYASDQLVEWMCDYGESIPRVLGSLAAVYAAFTLIYALAGSVVRELELPGGAVRVPTRDPAELAIFSLLVMTTGSPAGGLQPRGDLTLLLMGVQAFLGIALTGSWASCSATGSAAEMRPTGVGAPAGSLRAPGPDGLSRLARLQEGLDHGPAAGASAPAWCDTRRTRPPAPSRDRPTSRGPSGR